MLYRLDKLAGIFGICRQFLFQLTINPLTGSVLYTCINLYERKMIDVQVDICILIYINETKIK